MIKLRQKRKSQLATPMIYSRPPALKKTHVRAIENSAELKNFLYSTVHPFSDLSKNYPELFTQ